MIFFLPSLLLVAANLVLVSTADIANADNPTGQILYITTPACGFYHCTVTWPQGTTVSVNWIGIPPGEGNVSVSLQSNLDSTIYPIVESYPAVSQEGYCDAGQGVGVVIPGVPCGMVEFVIPMGWTIATNYTIVVQSLLDSTYVGYTDMINITTSNTTNPGTSWTSVSLLAIASPTSTDMPDSTSWGGTFPEPTALTGVAATTTAAAVVASSSSAVASSGAKSSSTSAAKSSSSTSSTSAPATTSKTGAAGVKWISMVGFVGVWGVGFCLI